MHVDRTMDVENRRRVSDFALGHANRDDRAAVFNCLTVDIRLMLMDIRAEQAMPEPSFFYAGRQAGSASLQAARVKYADIGNPAALSAFTAASAWGGVSYTATKVS